MSTVAPALPSFSDLQASQTPSAPTYSVQPSAPSGGAISPPVPVSPPGGMGSQPPAQQPVPVSPYIAALEAQGKIPVGVFKTEAELVDRLYSTSEALAAQIDQYEAQRTQQPAAPVAPAAPPVLPTEDLTAMAVPFQQQGWLSHESGQWVSKHPAAASLAQQLNQRVAEAQARQAELLSDTSGFITKHGKAAFDAALAPLKAELDQLKEQNQRLSQEIAKSVPKPHEAWVKQNEAQLWTTDPSGKRVPSAAGQAYSDAWDTAAKYQMSAEDIHKLATMAAMPHLTAAPAAPVAAPAPQPWMQQVAQNPPATNPAFTAPGTVFQNQVPPQARDAIYDNDGLPSFGRMQVLPQS